MKAGITRKKSEPKTIAESLAELRKHAEEHRPTNVACEECSQVFTVSRHPQRVYANFVCDECCERRAKREIEADKESSWKEICPPLYLNTDQSRLPRNLLRKAVEWRFSPKGILVAGNTGKGKTRAIWQGLRVQHSEGRSIIALDSTEFGREVAKRYGENPADAVRWLESLIKCDILFIDDLGKEKLTERTATELFGVIEGRVKQLRPIFATTNLSGAALKASLSPDRGEPLHRRLVDFCELVVV